jgi:lipopolysaccharide/colanic/teichoic acid biosynthesis glycosyltransferase
MTAKRWVDIALSLLVLTSAAPLLAVAMLLTWAEDRHSPLYLATRVARGGGDFRMVKLRSMTIDAERQGGTSTALSDRRITRIGRWLRRWKLDELPQFWNVLTGEMSIVGPRPNTRRGGVDRYTTEEMRLLSVQPGITDLASIVFSDEAEILNGAPDPDGLYDAVIRPWKSRLGLLYVDQRTLAIDLRIIGLTALAIVNKRAALAGVDAILAKWDAPDELRRICRRRSPLPKAMPPGMAA